MKRGFNTDFLNIQMCFSKFWEQQEKFWDTNIFFEIFIKNFTFWEEEGWTLDTGHWTLHTAHFTLQTTHCHRTLHTTHCHCTLQTALQWYHQEFLDRGVPSKVPTVALSKKDKAELAFKVTFNTVQYFTL